MFHLIFPFTQSTSNWCQLPAGAAFYTLRCCLPDATRTFRARSASCARRFGSPSRRRVVRSSGQTSCALIGPQRGGSPIVLVFHSSSSSTERESGGGEECARPRTGLLGNSQMCVVIVCCCCSCFYIYFSYCLSLCFSFFLAFDRGTLALIRSCWYCR